MMKVYKRFAKSKMAKTLQNKCSLFPLIHSDRFQFLSSLLLFMNTNLKCLAQLYSAPSNPTPQNKIQSKQLASEDHTFINKVHLCVIFLLENIREETASRRPTNRPNRSEMRLWRSLRFSLPNNLIFFQAFYEL